MSRGQVDAGSLFKELVVGEVKIGCSCKHNQCQCPRAAPGAQSDQRFFHLKAVAWTWSYLGNHVTMDKDKAMEMLDLGEIVTPLYAIVSQP